MDLAVRKWSQVETVLIREHATLTSVLHKQDLDSLIDPTFSHLLSLAVYGNLFAVMQKVKPALFAVLLDTQSAEETMEFLYKAIIVSSATKDLVPDDAVGFLQKLSEILCDTMRPGPNRPPRWKAVCDEPLDGLMLFRNLEAREMYILVKALRSQQHLLSEFMTYRFQSVDDEEIINRVVNIPMEVAPLYKTLCLSFRIEYFCAKLLSRLEVTLTDTGFNLSQLRAAVNAMRMDMPLYITHQDLSSSFLGFELDYDIFGFELHREFRLTQVQITRIFQSAAGSNTLRDWPLLARVVRAETVQARMSELMLVEETRIAPLMAYLRWATSPLPVISSFTRQRLVDFPLENLGMLLRAGTREQLIMAAPGLVRLILVDRASQEERIADFIAQRVQADVQVSKQTCEICKLPFADENKPVELCSRYGEFQGHFACTNCVRSWFLHHNRFSCPFCRRICQ